MPRRCAVCVLVALSLTASAAAQIPCRYDVTVIQGPQCGFPFGPPPTYVTGINELGHVCGYRWQCPPTDQYDEAFVWTPETGMVTIPRPAGVVSAEAADINDNGVVVGTYVRSGAGDRAFVFDHGVWTELPPPFAQGRSDAFAINNAGVVCGKRSLVQAPTPSNAFRWTARDGFIDMPDLGQSTEARDLNDSGIIVGSAGGLALPGQRGFVWIGEEVTILPEPDGSLWYSASSINASGVILGGSSYPNPDGGASIRRGIIWVQDKVLTLEPLPGYLSSGASDANDEGVVVGRRLNPSFGAQGIGTVWFNDSPILLTSLIEPAVVIESGRGINNDGVILAQGSLNGWPVGLLLTPVFSSPADLNCDGQVNTLDLGILIVSWSIPRDTAGCGGVTPCPADLNTDGLVNSLDLGILLVNWTLQP